jgi:hypothetical protein
MRRSWDEIRRQAKAFAEDWKDAHYEKGETQSFYNDFFEIFGVKRRQVAVYEKRVEHLDANRRGFIDLFWPGTLIVEQKSAGRDLFKAQSQAMEYFDWLPEARERYPAASLADLYDPDTMPGDLRKAHAALDQAVDRLYRPAPFASDRDRVEYLFGRYEALVNPLEREGVKQVKRVARKAAGRV